MLLSIFLPLLSFLGLAFFGRYLGKLGTIYWSIFNSVIGIIWNLWLYILVNQLNTNFYFFCGIWFNVSMLSVTWEFILDSLSVIMLLMVSIISGLVQLYSIDYMKSDPHFIRFMSYLSLFTFFMFVLVTANNFIQLFVGWEGVGICSYLLINFWTTRLQANKAAIKAVLMNRVGDIGFIIGISLLYPVWHSLDFDILHIVIQFTSIKVDLDFVLGFFILGVVAKSAQIGIHTWLPAAMEGPTPVSALIHAATMVTAGIFLVIRTSFFFELSTSICAAATCLGMFTAFLSALTAVFLYDIKRIIAYSTCSQLGYMLIAAGLSQYNISLFHLINHAFFKALLFLTAGAIIHSFGNEQDIRKLGLLYQSAPLLFSALFIGNMAIMGLPFLAGFYSKDLILEVSHLGFNANFSKIGSALLYSGISFATCLTAVYSCRLVYYIIFRQRQFSLNFISVGYLNQPFFIRLVLVVLMILSIFSGYLFSDFFSGINIGRLPSVYYAVFDTDPIFDMWSFEVEFFLPFIKLWPVFLNFLIIGCFFGILKLKRVLVKLNFFLHPLLFLLYPSQLNIQFNRGGLIFFFYIYYFFYYSKFWKKFVRLCGSNFYFNEFFNFFASLSFYWIYQNIFIKFDKGILEIFGPTGISGVYVKVVFMLSSVYKKTLNSYLFSIYVIVLFYFFLFIFF